MELSKGKVKEIRCKMEDILIELNTLHTKKNEIGSSLSMEELREISNYIRVIRQIEMTDFLTGGTEEFVQSRDVERMYARTLEVYSKIKRVTIC